jgi:hypothetical protein
MSRLAGNMFASIGEMVSWTKVLNGNDDKKTAEAEKEPKKEARIPEWVMQNKGLKTADN